MRSRLTRLVVATASMLALVGGLTPRAEAITVSTAAFIGRATIAAGLSYPCVGPSAGGAPTADLLLCPWRKVNAHPLNGDNDPTVLTVTLTLPAGHPMSAIPNVHVDFHHNKQAILGLESTTCVNEVENILKPPKAPAHVGLCSFTIVPNALNTVAGNCGLSSGQVVVAFTDALGNLFILDVHFNAVASKLILTGHVYKPGTTQRGKLHGVTEAVPVPTADLGNSCLRKTARVFTIAGTVGFVTVPL